MDAVRLNEILNSDMKLWEESVTDVVAEDSLIKSVDLPYNIGLFTAKFEGVTDGTKRAAAMQQWGALIRAEVENRNSDESVTARAAQRASQVSKDAGRRDVESGGSNSGEAPVSDTEAVPAHEPNPFTSREAAVSRINECRGRIDYHAAQCEELRLEMKALVAFAEVMGWELIGYDNAPKNQESEIESGKAIVEEIIRDTDD